MGPGPKTCNKQQKKNIYICVFYTSGAFLYKFSGGLRPPDPPGYIKKLSGGLRPPDPPGLYMGPGPIWARAKIDTKSIQEPFKIHLNLYLVFGPFWDRFFLDFGSNLAPQTTQKPNQKSIHKLPNNLTTKKPQKCISYWQGQWIRAVGLAKLSPNFMKNRCYIPSTLASKTMLPNGSILGPTWLHFGTILGPKLGPSWHQNRYKRQSE